MDHPSQIDERAAAQAERPLVVDLDGTLIKSDLLVEAFSALLSTAPLRGPGVLAALRGGRAAFKARVAAEVALDLANLPLNPELMAYLRAEHARGRGCSWPRPPMNRRRGRWRRGSGCSRGYLRLTTARI